MRYESRPSKSHYRTYWDEEASNNPMQSSFSVIEEDRDTFTGLFDHEGQEFHRVKEPIGFRIRG